MWHWFIFSGKAVAELLRFGLQFFKCHGSRLPFEHFDEKIFNELRVEAEVVFMAKLFRQNKLTNTVIERNFERMDILSVWIVSPVIIAHLIFNDAAQLLASIFVNDK